MKVQNLLKTILLTIFLVLTVRSADASHLYGSEFTYEYAGPSGNAANPFRYRLIYKIYVGNTVNTINQVEFNVFTKDLSLNNKLRSFTKTPGSTSVPLALPIPPGCTISNLPVIRLWTYIDSVDLPISFTGYYATASIIARNNDINNLQNPGGQNLFSYMDIPSPLTPSRSPVFTDTAVVVMFTGDTATIINSAYDVDGDKLIYSFNNPYGSTNTTTSFTPSASVPTRITYAPTFSLSQPFGPGGFASLNASTGLAKYYVPNQGNYVVSFQVKEYRNINGEDILIGTTIRDIQLVVRNPPPNTNTKPSFTHNGPPGKIIITEGEAIPPLTFTFFDPNPGDSLNITIKSDQLLDGPGGRNANINGSETSPFTLSKVLSGTTATLNFSSVCGDAGTYPVNIIVSDRICGTLPESDTYHIEVLTYQGPSAALGDTVVCANTTQTYSVPAKASATYSWALQGGGTISGSNTGSSVQVNWTSPGRHMLTVTETGTGNCQATFSFFVNVTPGLALTVSPPVTICSGGSAVLNVSGGTSYTWSDGTNTYTGTSITVNPTATTTYTVSSTATGGCVATGSVTVTVNQPPTISGGPNQTICAGTVTSMTATGAGAGGTYSWTDGVNTFTGQSIAVTPTVTTTYTVTGTTPGNCQNTGQVTITVTPLPVVSASASQSTICAGASATLTATGATTYSWTDGTNTFTGNSVNVSPTATTTYTVTGTSGTCTATSQVTVTVNPRPTVTGTNRIICAGQSTTLVATGADTYSWTDGTNTYTGNNVAVTPMATTTYTLTGTNTATGCSNTATVTVTVNPLPVIPAIPNQTICAGQSATLSAGTIFGNMTHSWSDGTNTFTGNPVTVSPTTTTTYTLTVLNITTGCSNTANVTVTVNPLPVVTATASQSTICAGESITLTATGADTYSWSGGQTGSTITVTPPGTPLPVTATFTVIGTNSATGCSSMATVSVTINPNPVVTVTNRTICIGASTTLVASGAGTGGTYSWTDGTTTYTGNNVTVSPTATTVYTVTGTNAANCTGTAQLTVTVNPLPVLPALADQTICAGAAATLSVGTPAPNTTYAWSGMNPPTPVIGPSVTVTPTTTTTYTVTATDNTTTCTNTATVTVTVNPLPVIPAIAPQTICAGETATLTVGTPAANTTYSWTGGPTTLTGTSVTVSPTATTTYTVTATNTVTSCQSTATVTVTVNPLPVSNAGPDKTICSGASTTLGVSAQTGHTYSWSPNLGLSSTTAANPTLTLTNTTTAPVNHTYTVTTTLNGCVTTDQVVVTVNPAITVDAGADQTLCDLKTVVVGTPAIAGYTYSWAANSGLANLTTAMPVFTASNTTANPVTIKLYVTATAFGCSKTDSVNVTINPRPLADSIDGNPSVCPGVQGVPYTIRNPRLTAYQWLVSGGTIASGQGTDAITVNWGAAGPGTVKAFTLNSFGCSSDTITLPVTINPILTTQKPTGPTQVCLFEAANLAYQVPFTTPGSVYTYQAFGGTITSANPSNTGVTVTWNAPGMGRLIVTETSTTSLASCFGVSDTLYVTILPSPDTTLAITGTDKACEFTQQLSYSLPGAANSTYAWTLNGTALAATGNSATIDLAAAGTYTLSVVETNAQGCPGRPIVKTITATPQPGLLTISGPANVCSDNLTGLTYSVTGLQGSAFDWTVTGSSQVSGNGTNSIQVDFDNSPGKTITVVETTADGCIGNPVTIPVNFDNAALQFEVASTGLIHDDEVVLNLSMSNRAGNQQQMAVYRREHGSATWNQVGSIPNSATTFTDTQVNTGQTVYEYKVESENECGTKLESGIHNTILLNVLADETQGIVTLNWNRYNGWANGVQEYQVFRKLDNETTFTQLNLAGGSITDTSVTLPASLVGFSQCYRIKAIASNSSQVSWSNGACADFANELVFFNIITPDGDGYNDAFVIRNVELYQGNELTIMNRWGNEVYKTKNYKNDWKGDNVSKGVYYYLLKLPDGKAYKGWVEVVK